MRISGMNLKTLSIFAVLFSLITTNAFASDTDNDGIDDIVDNCTNTPNHEQRDTDGDGYGNRCDAYFTNDNDCLVNVFDLAVFRNYVRTSESDGDINGDGDVDLVDVVLFKKLYSITPDQSASGICPL